MEFLLMKFSPLDTESNFRSTIFLSCFEFYLSKVVGNKSEDFFRYDVNKYQRPLRDHVHKVQV